MKSSVGLLSKSSTTPAFRWTSGPERPLDDFEQVRVGSGQEQVVGADAVVEKKDVADLDSGRGVGRFRNLVEPAEIAEFRRVVGAVDHDVDGVEPGMAGLVGEVDPDP